VSGTGAGFDKTNLVSGPGQTGGCMKTTVNVKGMRCAGCEALIEELVEELDGVKKVKADFKKGEVNVVFEEDKAGLEQIKGKIREAGYKPE